MGGMRDTDVFSLRKLKPGARPVEAPEDSYRLVSGADCRLMVFETVHEATRLWIKGRDFSVGRLLGDTYRAEADKYIGGALCIFRLAPQDYHRFHSPIDGVLGDVTDIPGQYYTGACIVSTMLHDMRKRADCVRWFSEPASGERDWL